MPAATLFDEPFYIRINEARWAAAEAILAGIRAQEIPLVTCLDVGSGPGWFTERLAAQGLRVQGLEGRAANIEVARRRLPGIQFHVVDIESERSVAALGRFDLVFCFGLLYHTENPFRAVRNLRSLTGSVLLLETILIPGSAPTLRMVGENVNETQGLSSYALIPTRPCLLAMLAAAGFPHVYDYAGRVPHEDFMETATHHQRRRIFLASTMELAVGETVSAPDVGTPKYDFQKTSTASAPDAATARDRRRR